ncbi:MAG TPA: anaerobic glycerol-3-phosphate dehydrogenase subunit GlpB [Actinomycetota bacterium]|nr:anaerobic glycerol-3-phosphate dehydrogenase subunit GlpB [Actinomycetota bacterium]
MTLDAVVVGAGLAGLTAGLRLADGGARVAVVARGVGSLHVRGGALDVLGYDPERVERPGERVAALAAARPEHPYACVASGALERAHEWWIERMATLRYAGGLARNMLLPTAVGALRPAAYAPATMTAGDAPTRVAIVGLGRLKDFYPAYLAANLRAGGVDACASTIDPAAGTSADVQPHAYARAFEQASVRDAVERALDGRLGDADAVGFPAVLGVDSWDEVHSDLERRLGRPVFEIPTLPPSVPGIRVYRALTRALRGAGARVVLGSEARGAVAPGRRARGVVVHASGHARPLRAGAVVLATGGVAGRGIEMDSRWRLHETALGLPVAWAPEPGEERFRAGYFESHPAARAGIAVDRSLRPVDAAGDVLHDDVFVAGAALGGAEPWKEKSGAGIDVTTGWAAAESVLGRDA